MSVEPSPADEATQVDPFAGQAPPLEGEEPRPTAPGGTPEGLGSERPAAPFTSEVERPAQGVTEILGNTGLDESGKADPV